MESSDSDYEIPHSEYSLPLDTSEADMAWPDMAEANIPACMLDDGYAEGKEYDGENENAPALVQGVMLGYGDVVHLARELDETGEPIWVSSNLEEITKPNNVWLRQTRRDLAAVGFGTDREDTVPPPYDPYNELFIVGGNEHNAGKTISHPAMGRVLLRRDKDGYWEPTVHWLGLGSTEAPKAVRVVGTLGAETIRELVVRNLAPQRESVFDEPTPLEDTPETRTVILDNNSYAPDRPRIALPHTFLADLGYTDNPGQYTIPE